VVTYRRGRTRSYRWLTLSGLLLVLPALAEPPLMVTIQPLTALQFLPQREAPAQVVTLNTTTLSARIHAPISKLPVRVGDRVEAGALVAQLACDDQQRAVGGAQAQLAGLQARLALANYQYERAQTLRRGNNISEELLRQRLAEREALQAEQEGQQLLVAQAVAEQQRCRITAPFPALVIARLAAEGELVQPGSPLLQLLDLAHLEVSAQIDQTQAAHFATASERWLALADGKRYPLQLRSLLPRITPQSRSQEARLQFLDTAALPGSFGRLQWQSAEPHLPAVLLQRRGDRNGIFIAQDAHATFIELPEASEGRPIDVSSIPSNSLIIVAGRQRLQHGDPIRVSSDAAAAIDPE